MVERSKKTVNSRGKSQNSSNIQSWLQQDPGEPTNFPVKELTILQLIQDNVLGRIFCQKFTQIGAWCNVIWFLAFGDALTTLCRNPRSHTCMTSLRRITQRINIGYMFKEWKLWKFSCIIGDKKLRAKLKFWKTLEGDLWVWSPLPVLNVSHRCQKGQTCDPQGDQKPKFHPANFWHFEYTRLSRILARISWSIWKPSDMNPSYAHFWRFPNSWRLKVKQKSDVDNLFWGYFKMVNHSNPAGGEPECGDSVLILSVRFFTVLTMLYEDPKVLHVHDVMSEKQSTCYDRTHT